jgi:hypothetical protein
MKKQIKKGRKRKLPVGLWTQNNRVTPLCFSNDHLLVRHKNESETFVKKSQCSKCGGRVRSETVQGSKPHSNGAFCFVPHMLGISTDEEEAAQYKGTIYCRNVEQQT